MRRVFPFVLVTVSLVIAACVGEDAAGLPTGSDASTDGPGGDAATTLDGAIADTSIAPQIRTTDAPVALIGPVTVPPTMTSVPPAEHRCSGPVCEPPAPTQALSPALTPSGPAWPLVEHGRVTTTSNDFGAAALPATSDTLQLTVVRPIGNTEPEARAQTGAPTPLPPGRGRRREVHDAAEAAGRVPDDGRRRHRERRRGLVDLDRERLRRGCAALVVARRVRQRRDTFGGDRNRRSRAGRRLRRGHPHRSRSTSATARSS